MKKMIIYAIIIITLLIIVVVGYFIYKKSQSSVKVPVESVAYYINQEKVTQKEFEKLKSQLVISPEASGGETSILPDGLPDGSEEHYEAVDTTTQEKYTYSIRYHANDPVQYQSLTTSTIEYREFSCPSMTGFTFKYPVFEGWTYYPTGELFEYADGSVGCEMTVDFEYDYPLDNNADLRWNGITVKKIDNYGLNNMKEGKQIPGFPGPTAKKNTQGIIYQTNLAVDSNSVILFGDNFGVEIKLDIYSFGSINDVLFTDQFLQTVIDSFKLTE